MVNRKNLVELRKTKNKNGLNKGLGLLGKGSIAACLSAAALLNAFGEIPANAFNTYHLMDNFGKSQLLVKSKDKGPAITMPIDGSTKSVLVIETDHKMNLKDRPGSLISIAKSVWGCDTDEEVVEFLRETLEGMGGSGDSELAELKRENSVLKNTVEKQSEKIEELNLKCHEYQKNFESLSSHIERLDSERIALSTENQKLKEKLKEKQTLDQSNYSTKSLKQKNLKSTSYGADEQVEELNNQIISLKNKLSNKELDCEQLRRWIEKNKNEQDLNGKAHANEIFSLQQEVESLKAQMSFDKNIKHSSKPIKTSSKMTAGGGNGDEVKELKKQVFGLKQELETSEQERRNLARELEINKLSAKKKISEMKNHLNQLNQLNQLNLQLKSQNNELLEELKHQKAHQTSGDCQNCNELKNENNELKERLNHLKFKISKSSIEQYKHQAKQFEQENVKLKNLVQETNEENLRLQSQFEESQFRLSKLLNSSRTNFAKKNEKQPVKNEQNTGSMHSPTVTSELSHLNSKKNMSGENSSRSTSKIDDEQSRIVKGFDETVNRYQIFEEENEQLKKNLESALEEIGQLKENHRNEEKKFYERSKKISDATILLTGQNSELKEEIKSLKEEVLRTSEKANKNSQVFFEKNLSLERSNLLTEQELNRANEKIQKLRRKKQELKEKIDCLKDEFEELGGKILFLHQHYKEALKSIDSRNLTIKNYSGLCDGYEKKSDSYLKEIDELKRKNEILAQKLNSANKQINKYKEELDDASLSDIRFKPSKKSEANSSRSRELSGEYSESNFLHKKLADKSKSRTSASRSTNDSADYSYKSHANYSQDYYTKKSNYSNYSQSSEKSTLNKIQKSDDTQHHTSSSKSSKNERFKSNFSKKSFLSEKFKPVMNEDSLLSIPTVISTHVLDSKSSSNFDNSDSKTNRSNSSSDNKKTSNKIQKSGSNSCVHPSPYSNSDDSKSEKNSSQSSGSNHKKQSSLITPSHQIVSISENKTSMPLKNQVMSESEQVSQIQETQKSRSFHLLSGSSSERNLNGRINSFLKHEDNFTDDLSLKFIIPQENSGQGQNKTDEFPINHPPNQIFSERSLLSSSLQTDSNFF